MAVSRTVWGAKGYTNATRPSDFLRSVLQNGCGRYVPQLQRLTFRFCQRAKESKQTRDFVENSLVNFAKNRPTVVMYITPEPEAEPKICAEYLNGRKEFVSLKDLNEEEILEKCTELNERSGLEIMRRRKKFHTDFPSIQGEWTPFTNKQNYSVKYVPEYNVTLHDAWEYAGEPWKAYYRKHELHKLRNRARLTFDERQNLPLGKWGPELDPVY